MDEDCNGSANVDAASHLWPTFVALFLLTLLYSGFITFIKVKGRDVQGARWSWPGTVRSRET